MSDDLQEWLTYHPETGKFTVKKLRPSQHRNKVGNEIGAINQGRYQIKTGNKKYQRSRLAWFFSYGVFPEGCIEHINGDILDDRICNLREISRNDVTKKVESNRRNSTGYPGVSFHKKSGKFSAQVRMGGKNYYLGLYEDAKEASVARKMSRDFLFGNIVDDIN
jgi:hypothetical protein